MNQRYSDEKLSVLSNHYDKSIETLKSNIKSRDRYFLFVMIFISIALMQISYSDLLELMLIHFFDLKDTKILNHNVISVIVWASTFFCFVKYSQEHSAIERSYIYISELEKDINNNFNGTVFKKESSFYKENKTYIVKCNKYIFKYIFPMLFIIVIFYNCYTFFFVEKTFIKCIELFICVILTHHIIFFSRES